MSEEPLSIVHVLCAQVDNRPPEQNAVLYAGTERATSYLTEALVRLGHNVRLYASGDSRTSANLVPVMDRSPWFDHGVGSVAFWENAMVKKVFEDVVSADTPPDVIHWHTNFRHLPRARRMSPVVTSVTTTHNRLEISTLAEAYRRFPDMLLIALSDNQRLQLPNVNWVSTIHHGLPKNLYSFHPSPNPEPYLSAIGRFSHEKGMDLAIQMAIEAEVPLRIAAKITDQDYFDQVIRPWLKHPLIDYVGMITDAEKNEFIGGSVGLLFTIRGQEPFGLVPVEALACGVPVVATPLGSVPELLNDQVSHIVRNVDEGVDAIRRLWQLERRACRDLFEVRYIDEIEAGAHVALYQRLREARWLSARTRTVFDLQLRTFRSTAGGNSTHGLPTAHNAAGPATAAVPAVGRVPSAGAGAAVPATTSGGIAPELESRRNRLSLKEIGSTATEAVKQLGRAAHKNFNLRKKGRSV